MKIKGYTSKEVHNINVYHITPPEAPKLELLSAHLDAFITCRKEFDREIDIADIGQINYERIALLGDEFEIICKTISKSLYNDENGWTGVQSLLMSAYSIAKANKIPMRDREAALIKVLESLHIEVIK